MKAEIAALALVSRTNYPVMSLNGYIMSFYEQIKEFRRFPIYRQGAHPAWGKVVPPPDKSGTYERDYRF